MKNIFKKLWRLRRNQEVTKKWPNAQKALLATGNKFYYIPETGKSEDEVRALCNTQALLLICTWNGFLILRNRQALKHEVLIAS